MRVSKKYLRVSPGLVVSGRHESHSSAASEDVDHAVCELVVAAGAERPSSVSHGL